MNEQELNDFKDRLAALTTAGDEAQVRALINENFARLPEDMRQDIVFNLFATSVEDELREQQVIADIQEEGLAAAEGLKQSEGKS